MPVGSLGRKKLVWCVEVGRGLLPCVSAWNSSPLLSPLRSSQLTSNIAFVINQECEVVYYGLQQFDQMGAWLIDLSPCHCWVHSPCKVQCPYSRVVMGMNVTSLSVGYAAAAAHAVGDSVALAVGVFNHRCEDICLVLPWEDTKSYCEG